MRTLALLTLMIVAPGCAEDGPSASTLIDAPRILAISAEPPVIGLDGSAEVRTLVVDADGAAVDAAAAGLSVRACSPWIALQDPDRDCGPDASVALVLDGEVARLDLAAVLARFPPPPDLVIPDGGGGTVDAPCPVAYDHVDLPIVVEATVADRAGELVRLTARKRVRVTWTPDVARTNPRIEAFRIDGAEATTIAAGAEVMLQVGPELTSLDRTCNGDDPPALVLEPIRINLFATAGELGTVSVDARYDPDDAEELETTTYRAPDDGDAVIWAIATDADGGTGWARFDVSTR